MMVVMMLATLLPLGAAPAYADPATEVHVGKATLNATTPYLVDGVAKATGDIAADNCTAHFDATIATLTLSGLNLGVADSYESGNSRYGIYAIGDLTIELLGENTIVAADGVGKWGGSCGIGINPGNLTLNGTGSLVVTSGAGSYVSGIDVSGGNLIISNGTITATGGTATEDSTGLCSNQQIIIHGGTITATGGISTDRSMGLYAGWRITIHGGTITATGGTATKSSMGLYTGGGNPHPWWHHHCSYNR